MSGSPTVGRPSLFLRTASGPVSCPARPSTYLASVHSCEGITPQLRDLSHFFSWPLSLIPSLDAEHIPPGGSSPFLVRSLATVSSTPCPWEPPATLSVTHPAFPPLCLPLHPSRCSSLSERCPPLQPLLCGPLGTGLVSISGSPYLSWGVWNYD